MRYYVNGKLQQNRLAAVVAIRAAADIGLTAANDVVARIESMPDEPHWFDGMVLYCGTNRYAYRLVETNCECPNCLGTCACRSMEHRRAKGCSPVSRLHCACGYEFENAPE